MVTFAPSVKQIIGEKRVTLHHLTWQSYQQILQALPLTRAARLTFDRGVLEITMPLQDHKFFMRLIERFIIILVVEMGMKVKTMGSTTIERPDLNRAAEPDCAYYIQNYAQVAGRKVNFAIDPPPDLVVEVDITHTDIDKNLFYATLGVPEFWRFNGKEWRIFQLKEGSYQKCDRSPTFPWVKKEYLYNFLAEAERDEVLAEQNWRQFVRDYLGQQTL
ncbi:MAG: Uma2 family endonuclease [Pseudanabaenaceae cyanobacterium SKYGB_i_bin29]|nr:Uma2 family endonuclease [Pseudanabaenaceae cyanobacterium SKYG29]MDW8422669.1 Uma2 family endonuclease [Pseudanabaenaceae cyanobacterium SKYGB_i_bin29]